MDILEGYDRKRILQSGGFIEAMDKAVAHQTEDIIMKYLKTDYYSREGKQDESLAIDDLKTELDCLANKMKYLVLFMNDELTNQKEENTDESD